AEGLGYPLVLRPSFVLGGRAMEIVHNRADLELYVANAVHVSGDAPLLIDRYLRDAIEVDVDAICDGEAVHIAGVMQHIEEAGVHSGDSACALPPHSLSADIVRRLEEQAGQLARALRVRGLLNVQFAIQGEDIYVLEANPRASRTVPFVAKATDSPVAAIAAKVMAGARLDSFDLAPPPGGRIAVKEAVMPFARFPGADPVLGPEMRSTGEVMGMDSTFEGAYAKSQLAASIALPRRGTAFLSVKDSDKGALESLAADLLAIGFTVIATEGTARRLRGSGLPVETVSKVFEGRPHIVDKIKNGEVQLICNTTEGRQSLLDSYSIRRTALTQRVPCYTTVAAAQAAARSIRAVDEGALEVRSLQSYSTEVV
ncbi:MAG: ATP-grasp domain-containing protein, partial [Caulobacterales bacterium]|nr:ATP-grasp domain-containing protein [Caulobacterales bacterium]